MTSNHLIDRQIDYQFSASEAEVPRILEPLVELSQESGTLLIGYGAAQGAGAHRREDLIPYFHVCGHTGSHRALRVLVIGGWAGTETLTTYVIARLLAAIEKRFHLVDGIEVTAYPMLNLEAHRAGVALTESQVEQGIGAWSGSPVNHIRVLERELWRYDYDLVVRLREVELATEFSVEAWPSDPAQRQVLADTFKAYAQVAPEFQWKIDPLRARYSRRLTPVPDRLHQPAEIVVALPGAHTLKQLTENGLGLLLTILHAAREARAEGVL